MLAKIIRNEIVARGGILPFAGFMELALYCPKLGYYETKKDTVGRRGDFYTSVSVGSLFGELLAFQFAEWLKEIKPSNSGLKIIEAGDHDGKLAKDILTSLQSRNPDLFGQIEYCILEPSAPRQEWQCETLKDFAGKVRWLSDLTAHSVNGIIFSNELLDAFPVRRFGWDAGNKGWFEWGVAVDGDKFVWAKIEKIEGDLPAFDLPSGLLDVLPDNFTTETNPAAADWWRVAANSLNCGILMTADYGLISEEFFAIAKERNVACLLSAPLCRRYSRKSR